MRKCATRIVASPAIAEDVTQDAFLNLFRKIEAGESPENPTAYLVRTATNLSLNILRNRNRRRAILETSVKPGLSAVETPQAEIEVAIRGVLWRTEQDQAEAAVHYHVHGLTLTEVSTLMGLTVGKVRGLLQKFKEAAREILESPDE